MSFCRIHGDYWNSANGCPYCQQAEEETQRRLDDIANRLGGTDFGDYVCPHCRYKSLRRNAKRCPLCQADPGPEFWLQVDSEERAKISAAKVAAEQARLREIQQAQEWEHGAPARAAAAAKAAAAFVDAAERGKTPGFTWLVIPILNWVACLAAFINNSHVALRGLLACGVTALALWMLLKAVHTAVLARIAYLAIIFATILHAMTVLKP